MVEGARATPAAIADWVELSDALTRGIVHAFNNRFTALSAYAELAAMGDEEFAPARILPAELVRLQALNAQLHLLVSENMVAEAMEVAPVLDDALSLLAHHPRARTVRCAVECEENPLPVRAPRWALLRLLMVLVEDGRRAAQHDGREHATLRIGSKANGLLLAIDAPSLAAYGVSMAELCYGVVTSDADGSRVQLPSLAELRHRERAAAATRGD